MFLLLKIKVEDGNISMIGEAEGEVDIYVRIFQQFKVILVLDHQSIEIKLHFNQQGHIFYKGVFTFIELGPLFASIFKNMKEVYK